MGSPINKAIETSSREISNFILQNNQHFKRFEPVRQTFMCTKERLYDTFAVLVYVQRMDCMMVLVIIRVCIRGGSV